MSSADNREALVAELVAMAIAASEENAPPDLDAICAAHPELRKDVHDALQLVGEVESLHLASDGHEARLGTTLLDRYQLEQLLGRGASGSVYAATDRELDREVAVKILHAGMAQNANAEERFLREAVLLAQNEHPHLVRIYDRGRTSDGQLFLVTERLQGIALDELLHHCQQRMSDGPTASGYQDISWLQQMLPKARLERSLLRQIVAWIADLGAGLSAAHEQQVFHRDVKPSNAFIRADGSAVLLDFGLATQTGDASLTLPQGVIGTPWYMPPEQASGNATPSATLDVYGLAATLYHLITLQPPQVGDLGQVLAAARDRDPTPAAQLHSGLPRDLQAILDCGLEREPKRRYATTAAFVQDLEAFLDHRPPVARPIGNVRRAVRRAMRRPWQTSAAVAGALAIAFGIVAYTASSEIHAGINTKEHLRLTARLPALLAVEGMPDQRLAVPISERTTYLSDLNRILELDASDVQSRMLRASVRLDAGDVSGAREDLAILQTQTKSPYLAAVAACYQRTDSSAQGIQAVLLSDLPEPTQPEDYFVAGFHQLRLRNYLASFKLLSKAEDFAPARDLRLITMLALLNDVRGDEFRRLLGKTQEEIVFLKGQYGQVTARTAHARSVVLLYQGRHHEAIEACQESLSLRAERHGPWINQAVAHYQLGNLQDAMRCADKAIALRPPFENNFTIKAQILRELGRFDEARAVANQSKIPWRKHWSLGNIAYCECTEAMCAGDRSRMKSLGKTAYDEYRKSAEDPNCEKKDAVNGWLRTAYFLQIDNGKEALYTQLRLLKPDNIRASNALNIVRLLDEQPMDRRSVDALQLYFLRIAHDLQPQKPEVRAALNAVNERIKKHQ